MDDGSEKRIYEIDANTIEKISGSAPSNADFSNEEIAHLMHGEQIDVAKVMSSSDSLSNLFMTDFSNLEALARVMDVLDKI